MQLKPLMMYMLIYIRLRWRC